MMIPCTILKSFPYSLDGFTPSHAEAGSVADIPAGLIEGLASEGYLRAATAVEIETRSVAIAPENKAIRSAPENKHALVHDGNGRPGGAPKPERSDDLASLRAEYQTRFGKRPFMGWNAAELRERLEE